MSKKNAQSSIEFMILVGFVLFFFALFILIIQGNISDRTRERQNLLIKELALSVQDEIRLANGAGEGYIREFNVPEKVGNLNYEISIPEGVVYIKTTDDKIAIALPIQNVSADSSIIKGTNVIKKEDGEVKLNA